MFNLILDEEDVYGFLYDLRHMFEDNLTSEDLDDNDKDILNDALARIDQLEEDDEGNIYHCWYNPMGAYIFTKMVEEK